MSIDKLLENGTQKKMPDWTSPMLAKLTHEHFESQDWLYERKLEGERCLVFCQGKDKEVKEMVKEEPDHE
jgi:bifunctional non-homologous end joining protein LigD